MGEKILSQNQPIFCYNQADIGHNGRLSFADSGTITKRGDTFRIKVSLGYDTEHKQIIKSTTFKPPQGVTPKKAEKLTQQFAYEFESRCKDHTELNENMRFSELAEWYFENYAPEELKPTTVLNYESQYRNHIHYTLSCVDGECYLDSPKTKGSIRMIAMNSTVEKCLRDQQTYVEQLKIALGNKYAHPEMVFPSGLGNYRDRSSVYHSLKRMTKGTEFEDMTLHKLRHCNATLLLNSGVDIKVVSEHLGHCDIGVTANIYADVLKSTKAKVADLVALKLT